MTSPKSLLVAAIVLAACALAPAAFAEPDVGVILPLYPPRATENDHTATFNVEVRLSGPMDVPITVTLQSENGTALAGQDYVALSRQLTFEPGQTVKLISYVIIGDIASEGVEYFLIRAFQNGAHRSVTRIEINDDDHRPSLRVFTQIVPEGTNRTTYAFFNFSLDRVPKVPVRFDYRTADGTATAGKDYIAKSGTMVIPAGTATNVAWQVHIELIADADVEPDETILLHLSNGADVNLGLTPVQTTIEDDDVYIPPFSIRSGSKSEGDSGSKQVYVDVALTTASTKTVFVTVKTTGNGTATAGTDYQPFTEAVTFPPGITEASVAATIFGDTLEERDERFEIAVIEDGHVRATGFVQIIDDDTSTPVVTVADLELRETDDAPAKAVFAVTLSKPTREFVRVLYETVPETAAAFHDFVVNSGELVFAPGETSRTVTVDVIGDRTREQSETFRLELLQPRGMVIGDGSGVCTIVDNEGTKRRPARHCRA